MQQDDGTTRGAVLAATAAEARARVTAERIRRETGVAMGAVGLIEAPVQAGHIIRSQRRPILSCLLESACVIRTGHCAQPVRPRHEVPWPVQYEPSGVW